MSGVPGSSSRWEIQVNLPLCMCTSLWRHTIGTEVKKLINTFRFIFCNFCSHKTCFGEYLHGYFYGTSCRNVRVIEWQLFSEFTTCHTHKPLDDTLPPPRHLETNRSDDSTKKFDSQKTCSYPKVRKISCFKISTSSRGGFPQWEHVFELALLDARLSAAFATETYRFLWLKSTIGEHWCWISGSDVCTSIGTFNYS